MVKRVRAAARVSSEGPGVGGSVSGGEKESEGVRVVSKRVRAAKRGKSTEAKRVVE